MKKFSFNSVLPDVPFDHAPLERCLLQLRFSPVPELLDDSVERLLSEHLEPLPVRNKVMSTTMVAGMSGQTQEVIRTFESVDGMRRASVAADFVAFETTEYTTRDEFLREARLLIETLATVRRPARITRVGIRYTNAFNDIDSLLNWVKPPLLGWIGALEEDTHLDTQLLYATLVKDQDSRVAVRTAFVPAGAVLEPGMSVKDIPRWFLDIDAYDETPRPGFETDPLMARLNSLAKDAQQVFAWAAEDFIAHGGGVKYGE